MFPSTTARRPNKRSLRELVRKAVDTAVVFVTLGEASSPEQRLRRTAPTHEHPHRRRLGHHRSRRPGEVRARAQVCTTPLPHSARH